MRFGLTLEARMGRKPLNLVRRSLALLAVPLLMGTAEPPVPEAQPDVASPASVVPSLVAASPAPATPATAVPAPPEATAAAPAAPDATDTGAQLFMLKCMGCHTIGGGLLSGPDLKPMSGWPRANLLAGVKRMEKSVGPLSDDFVATMADFLLSPDAAARVTAAQQAMAVQQAAKLEAPSPEKGNALFLGRTVFAGGGIACAACHQADGKGGSMAASLEDAYTRLGEAPLLATCESPGYPVMRAIYTPRPVTKQEAVHLVAFLKSAAEKPKPPANPPLSVIGILGGIGLTVGMALRSGRKSNAGTRARMVAQAHQRRDMGRGRAS